MADPVGVVPARASFDDEVRLQFPSKDGVQGRAVQIDEQRPDLRDVLCLAAPATAFVHHEEDTGPAVVLASQRIEVRVQGPEQDLRVGAFSLLVGEGLEGVGLSEVPQEGGAACGAIPGSSPGAGGKAGDERAWGKEGARSEGRAPSCFVLPSWKPISCVSSRSPPGRRDRCRAAAW